jgi:hypothetical protein
VKDKSFLLQAYLYLRTRHFHLHFACFGQPGGGDGNVVWMGPPLSSFPAGQPIHGTFIIIPILLRLSPVLQGGERLVGLSPTSVLTHVKVETKDMDSPNR